MRSGKKFSVAAVNASEAVSTLIALGRTLPSEVSQMITRDFLEVSSKNGLFPHSDSVALRQLNSIHEKGP